MAPKKSPWTDHVYSPINVLNHAKGLHLDRFTSEDLDLIAGCDDVLNLSLRSSKMTEPVDLARIAHIRNLHFLHLDRLNFTNLAALRALPHLYSLSITDCVFTDFEALNGFHALELLTFRRNKITRFPAGLDLPLLSNLTLHAGKITDLGFVQSYPRLRELDVSENQIRDLAPLAECPALEDLDVTRNPIASLSPLAGRKFTRILVDTEHSAEAAPLRLPEERYVPSEENAAHWQVAKLMQAKDWKTLYAISDLALLAGGFSNLMHDHFDEEILRGALAHPAEGAFHAMVASGLRPHYAIESELLVDVLSGEGERIIAPMTECFHAALAQTMFPERFYAGKMDLEHATIMRILLKVASPAYTDLFLAYFNDRNSFSELHLHFYKKLLDVVAKTEASDLVAPLIDMLGLEKHIIGGDAAFMKKLFKAIGQLGRKSDAALLANQFNVADEGRQDVAAAYQAAIARLSKKKA